jgi:hypothetical protein
MAFTLVGFLRVGGVLTVAEWQSTPYTDLVVDSLVDIAG